MALIFNRRNLLISLNILSLISPLIHVPLPVIGTLVFGVLRLMLGKLLLLLEPHAALGALPDALLVKGIDHVASPEPDVGEDVAEILPLLVSPLIELVRLDGHVGGELCVALAGGLELGRCHGLLQDVRVLLETGQQIFGL